MKKKTKNKLRRVGNRTGKSITGTIAAEQFLYPIKRRVTQADVKRAGERSEVEQQATLVASLSQRVAELQGEQQHLESRLQQTRTDIATTMLAHVEATQKFKDMTALQQRVP